MIQYSNRNNDSSRDKIEKLYTERFAGAILTWSFMGKAKFQVC